MQVALVDNVVEAEVLRQVLEDASIRCILRNQDPHNAYSVGALPRAIGILVLEDDAERARALIGSEE